MLMELLLEHYTDENTDKTDVQGALVMLSRTNVSLHCPRVQNFKHACTKLQKIIFCLKF